MSSDDLPILGITMGDAAGVGPEVTVIALTNDEIRAKARVVVIGDASIMADAARIVGCSLPVRAIDEIRPDEIDGSAIWVLDLKNRPLDGLVRGKVDAVNGKGALTTEHSITPVLEQQDRSAPKADCSYHFVYDRDGGLAERRSCDRMGNVLWSLQFTSPTSQPPSQSATLTGVPPARQAIPLSNSSMQRSTPASQGGYSTRVAASSIRECDPAPP